MLPNLSLIKVKPIQKKYSDIFPTNTLSELKTYNIDVMIRAGFRILRGDILKLPKYGIWSYHHGDNFVNRGGPPGFWEVFNEWGETGVVLQILSENLDGGTALYRSFSQTECSSVNRNINNYYWKSSLFLPRKLKELYSLGEIEFFKKVNLENQHPSFYSNKLFTTPSNYEMFMLLIKYVGKYLKKKLHEKLYYHQWELHYSIDKKNDLSKTFYKFNKIIPPKNKFWADPHFIKKDDKYYIYFEDYDFSDKKGNISCIELDRKGSYSEPKTILAKDYHLSFPSIFQVNDDYYMIPETAKNKNIQLYKCTQFPYKWVFQKELMSNILAVDANLFNYNSKWWIFVNLKENEGTSFYDELFLFYSNSHDSTEWTPHPKNPIVSDVKSARPAGSVFKYNNNIYRPSQNSMFRYGYGISINKIIKLNETDYEEEQVSSILPNWHPNYIGTHTINYKDDFTIIDVLVKKTKYKII
jgi:hypothetical protein